MAGRGMTPEGFKTRLSDHYIVTTTVQIMPDDD